MDSTTLASPSIDRRLPYDRFVDTATQAIGAATAREPVSLLVGDVDHYRRLAELHGEAYAQSLVAELMSLVAHVLRDGDVVAHPGGDELLVLLRTGLDGARDVAERLCVATRVHAFPAAPDGSGATPTISIGVAAAPDHGAAFAAVHAAADGARVRLKGQGRDGAAVAPLAHHEALHRPLDIGRFAGRTAEMRGLAHLVDAAADGRPHVVAIVGERGTGTSSLVRQVETEIRFRGGSLVQARCSDPAMAEPYGLWSAVLRSLARLPGAPANRWRDLPRLNPDLPAEPGAEHAPGTKYRLLEELVSYLRLAAAVHPLVILLDEMQWADAASWDALEHVIEQLDGERLLFCLTFQADPAFAEANERRQQLMRHESYQEIQLSRLTRDEVKRWLEGAFHRQEIGREFLAFLYRHTEGNPLFIAEVLRTLVEEGALWHSGERWEWSPVSELRLPTGLPALLQQRLARFSASTLAVLSTAAVIGREFDIPLVVAAGAGSEPAVQLALGEALVAGLIHPTYERRRGAYSFAHDRIVDVLARAIPPEQLRLLNERVAHALARRPAAADAEIALHYDHAGEQALAYRHALRAATRAEGLYAHAAATSLLHVAARNATTPGELAEVRVRLATLAETVGRYDEAEELCDLAIEWFEGQGDQRRALTLRRMRERARKELGQPARVTLDALLALDSQARDLSFERERVAILTMLSQTYQRLGDPRAAERIADEGVAMAEQVGDPSLLADALNRLAVSVYQDSPERAREIYLRALALFEGTGDVRGQARCHINLGAIALHGSDWDAAREAYGRAIALARAAGMPDLWGTAAANLGVIAHRNGAHDHARELLGESLALFATVKNSELQLYALYNLAHIEWESGAWEQAAELYEATASLAKRIGADDVEIGAMAGEGLALYELGKIDAANQAYAMVEDRIRARNDWFQGREFAEALAVRVLAGQGRLEEALSRFESSVPHAENMDLYSAAWLTVVCGRVLCDAAGGRMQPWVVRFRDRVRALGYAEMSRQLDALLGA